MSKAQPRPGDTPRARKLNRRALVALPAGLLALSVAAVALWAFQNRRNTSSLLAEARAQAEAGQPELAINYVNSYLDADPASAEGHRLKGEILAATARSETDPTLGAAINAYNQALAREPDPDAAQEIRRQLIDLNLRIRPIRVRPAEVLARDLVARGADDPAAHRLLARTLELSAITIPGPEAAKNLDEAIAEYQKAEEEDPGDVVAAERLATLYRTRREDPGRALALLDQALQANAGDPAKLAAVHLARSRHFTAVGDSDAARAEVDRALEVRPDDFDARLLRAEMAAQRGDTAAAREDLAKVDPARRDDLRIKLVSGVIELREQRMDDAVQSWRSGLMQVGGRDEQLNYQLALILLQLGRVDEARPLIEQYLRLSGVQGQAGPGELPLNYVYLKAAADRRAGQTAEAIKALESIRYKADASLAPQVYFELGQAYEAARRPADALAAYREAARTSRRWPGPWLYLARLAGASGGIEAAIAELRDGLDAIPDDPTLLAGLGQALWRQQVVRPEGGRDWSELEAVIARAKRAAPNLAEVATLEADYLNATGNPDRALESLQEAVRLNPNSAPLWLATANVQARLGRVDQALETLERAASAAGEQAAFRATRAQLLLAQNKAGRARSVLTEGLDKVGPGQRPALWKALAELYLSRNDREAARKAYAEWVQLQPEAPEPRLALVDLALAEGDRQAAEAEVEALKGDDGKSLFYRIGRVQVLLSDGRKAGEPAPADAPADPGRQARLDEAAGLIEGIKADNPKLYAGNLLEGRLLEARGQVDEAIRAYERALEDQAGAMALRPLIALLAREDRGDEIRQLRESPFLTPELRRLAAELTLKAGDAELALQMVDRIVEGDPNSLDLRSWQARVLSAMGKGEEAEQAIRALIRQRPAEPAPYLQLLILQAGRKDEAAARQTVEEMRSRVKSDRPELLLGLAYRILGDGPRAAEAYRAALARWPDDQRVLLAAVSYFEAAGQMADAEAALRRLLKLDPTQAWAARKLALILADRPRDAAAWKEAVELVASRDDGAATAEDRIAHAVVLGRGFRPEDRRRGIEILQGLVADDPDNVSAQYHLARLLLQDRQTQQARVHAARAAESEEAGGDPILLYAGMVLADKDFDKAEALLGRLEKLAPGSLPAIELAARIQAGRGEVDAAVARLEAAFDERAKSPEAFTVGQGIMKILMSMDRAEAAGRIGRKLTESVGSAGAALMAELEQARGDTEAALAAMEKAVAGDDPLAAANVALNLGGRHRDQPRWLELAERGLDRAEGSGTPTEAQLQSRALLYHLQGRHPEEVEVYEKLLAAGPTNFLFLNNMAWTLSESLGRPEDGLRRVDEAIERIGYEPHIVDTRGVILTRLGRLDEAIKDLEAAVASLPTAPVIYHLARAYHKAGRDEDFRKAMAKAREAGLEAKVLSPGEAAEMEELLKL